MDMATNPLECQNMVPKNIMDWNTIDVVYTDFSKVFDKFSHNKLMFKLRAYDVDGYKFSKGRKQCGLIGNVEYKWEDVTDLISSCIFSSYSSPRVHILKLYGCRSSINSASVNSFPCKQIICR